MISMDYAGKFAKWDTAKIEIDELNNTLENAANLRPDLAQTIQIFRSTYTPRLKDAADKNNVKNFEAVWNNNAIISNKLFAKYEITDTT